MYKPRVAVQPDSGVTTTPHSATFLNLSEAPRGARERDRQSRGNEVPEHLPLAVENLRVRPHRSFTTLQTGADKSFAVLPGMAAFDPHQALWASSSLEPCHSAWVATTPPYLELFGLCLWLWHSLLSSQRPPRPRSCNWLQAAGHPPQHRLHLAGGGAGTSGPGSCALRPWGSAPPPPPSGECVAVGNVLSEVYFRNTSSDYFNFPHLLYTQVVEEIASFFCGTSFRNLQ